MEIHYWTPTLEEARELTTYDVVLPESRHAGPDIFEVVKQEPPDYCRLGSELPHVIAKAKAWFAVSNKEDLYVLEQEKLAFDAYYNAEHKEILAALAEKK